MAPADTSGLTAFERRRAENAKANNEILKAISKTSAKVFGAAQTKKTPQTKKAPSRKRAEPVKREAPMPTRRSARVAGIDADPETLKRKHEVEEEIQAAAVREKRLRVSGDLQLGDLQVDGKQWQGSLDGLNSLGKMAAQPGVRTFTEDDVTETSDKELKALRKEMNGLQLYDKFQVKDLKLTKERIYAMAFHPTKDKPIIFAGDKEGRLGIFDASQEPDVPAKVEEGEDEDDAEAEPPTPVIIGLKPHARTISAVYLLDSDPNSVYTSSYDTTIRKLDIQAQKSVEVYAPDESDSDGDAAISCMDFAADNPHTVYFSTLQGALGRHDVRDKPDAADVWAGLHDGHKIGGFSLSPRQPHLVATASLDRTVKIWDLRKIAAVRDDNGARLPPRPALLASDPARLSVSHAAWGPGGHIATTSYDDQIRVYNVQDAATWKPGVPLADGHLVPAHAIRHNNQTGRWVTILKPQWQRHPPPGTPARFAVGNMNRFVDVYAANGDQLAQLDGDGITAVPAVAHFHPSQPWVAGGNASGKLSLWMSTCL